MQPRIRREICAILGGTVSCVVDELVNRNEYHV